MLVTGQVAGSATASHLTTVPAGPGVLVLTNNGTATVYIGAGTSVTTGNGVPIPSGGVLPVKLFQGGPGGPLSVVTASGSATIGYLISTSYGLAQPGQQ